MPELFYQTLQVENRSIPGPSGGNAVGAGVKLLHKASKALNGWAVSWRINQEIEELKPRIQEVMPRVGGVLICVGVQEWKYPDPTGSKAQSFLSIHIAGAGPDPANVLRKYRSQDRLVSGPSEGWVRKDVFIWVTGG